MVQTLQAFFKKFLTTTIAAAMVVFLFGVGVSFAQYVNDFEENNLISGVTGYDIGVYEFNGINWQLGPEALRGTLSGDIKNGNAAARIRNNGMIMMVEDKSDGLGSISFLYSRSNFSGDRTGTAPSFIVEYSTNGGDDWNQIGSTTSLDGVDSLTEFSETVEVIGDVRVRIVQVDGASGNRWNVDDIIITDFTEDPTINVSPSSLSGLNYQEGAGPSSEQTFSVSGSNLVGNITLTPPSDFEISETSGNGFTSGDITLNETDGSVSSTTIYVRLADGLGQGDYDGNITLSTPDADDVTVALFGSVAEPFSIPYSNGFRSTESFNLALSQGFSVSNASHTTSAGGYINVSSGGYVETPAIDFTEFDYLETKFDITTFGTGSNREFSVRISNDDGESYTTIDSYFVPGAYQTFTTVLDLTGTEFNVSEGKIRFEMTAGTGGTRFRDLEINEVEIYDTEISEDGGASWRMLSLPVGDVAINVLAGQNLVQGVSGGDTFYNDGGEYDDAESNILYYLTGEEDEEEENAWIWNQFDNFGSTITSGQGFIWYMYDNDEFSSVPLPFTLSVSGNSPTTDVTIPINPSDDFTLIGNPFADNLDASNVSGWGDLQATARTWDPDEGAEGDYVNTTDSTPSFTGFFVETEVGGSGDITIPVAATSSKAVDSEHFRIALNLQGINDSDVATSDNSTSVLFRDGATNDWDVYDATKLVPLLSSYATIGIIGERAGEERIQAIDSRPIDFSGELDLPLALNVYNFGGEFELSADLINVPEEWSLHLTDNETGETVDLRQSAYTFTYNSSAQKVVAIENKLPETFTMSAEEAVERFTLTIDAETGVNIDEPGTGLPDRVALNQNYPNPFNPSTVISYDLPEASDVTIQVYDMTGRQVATLVNSRMEAGTHEVTFNAGNLASGVYIYRLQAGEHMLTRKLTLIK